MKNVRVKGNDVGKELVRPTPRISRFGTCALLATSAILLAISGCGSGEQPKPKEKFDPKAQYRLTPEEVARNQERLKRSDEMWGKAKEGHEGIEPPSELAGALEETKCALQAAKNWSAASGLDWSSIERLLDMVENYGKHGADKPALDALSRIGPDALFQILKRIQRVDEKIAGKLKAVVKGWKHITPILERYAEHSDVGDAAQKLLSEMRAGK